MIWFFKAIAVELLKSGHFPDFGPYFSKKGLVVFGSHTSCGIEWL